MQTIIIKNVNIDINDVALLSTEDINDLQTLITLELKRRGEVAETIATDLPAYAIESGVVRRTGKDSGYVGSGVISWVGVKYTVSGDGEAIVYTLVP